MKPLLFNPEPFADNCLIAYAVYFDHKRQTDPEFRKALKRESRREARAAKEQAEAEGAQQKQAIETAVTSAKEDGFPTDLEEKEAYFMNEVARGETLCQEGMASIIRMEIWMRRLIVFQVQMRCRPRSASTKL